MNKIETEMPVGATTEDADMKQLMAKWDAENEDTAELSDDDDDACSVGDCDNELEQYRHEVHANDNALDHIVLGTSDLARSIEDFGKLTGVKPVSKLALPPLGARVRQRLNLTRDASLSYSTVVISLNGLGTKSASVSFDGCSYVEIIGPDPKHPGMPLGDRLSKIKPGKMVPIHYAIRNTKASEMKKKTWPDMGFGCDKVTMVAVDRGMPWKWDLIFLEGHNDGGLVPFFIDWGDASHAAGKLPIVGSLGKVVVRAPTNNAVHKVLAGVDGIDAQSGEDLFEFSFKSSNGTHTFSASELIGISFPKQGGLLVKQYY
jgi:hypothetical protein